MCFQFLISLFEGKKVYQKTMRRWREISKEFLGVFLELLETLNAGFFNYVLFYFHNCGLCCVVLCLMSNSLQPYELYSPQHSPGQNTRVGSLFLLQGWNPGLPHCRQILYQLSHKRSSRILEWVAYPSSSRSSRSRNQTCIARVSCIASGFFTT